MIRLILHTGRFRDMGYETALSGAEPTAEARAAADRLLASLRRDAPKGGFGIVVRLSHAGRAIEEILAVTSPEPFTAESEERLRAELTRLHRDALPELLKVSFAGWEGEAPITVQWDLKEPVPQQLKALYGLDH